MGRDNLAAAATRIVCTRKQPSERLSGVVCERRWVWCIVWVVGTNDYWEAATRICMTWYGRLMPHPSLKIRAS
jgi:hypothetical protein